MGVFCKRRIRVSNLSLGGPYTKNDRGCFLANFKPNRGDYAADQALYTVEAKSYEPNGYNLYNMAGNVSEWTDSSYDLTHMNMCPQ
jgi:formylglycine-generating enzyme required for sulfatase activity